MITVAIPFAPMPRQQNPNIRSSGKEDVYLRAAYVTFASVQRWNPDADLIFVTNIAPSEQWVSAFSNLDVTVKIVPFDHTPPEGFAKSFAGSLYLLDALMHVDAEYLLLIDPDVVCVNTLDPLLKQNQAVSALLIPSPPTVPINGLKPFTAQQIQSRLDGNPMTAAEPPRHLGGELYGIPHPLIKLLRERAEMGWMEAIRAWKASEEYFHTEEHIMTYALSGMPVAEASRYARRVWTAHGHRTVYGDEDLLALWHLPAEKERGFTKLYRAATEKSSWFWRSEQAQFTEQVARICGIYHRGVSRTVLDIVGHSRRAF